MPPRRPRFLTEEEKKNRPKITKALILRILSYLKPYMWMLGAVLVLITLSSVLGLMPSILTGRIIDEGILGKNLDLLLMLSGLSLVVLLGSSMLSMLQSYLTTRIAQQITRDMKNQMFGHLQKMSQRFFADRRSGDIVTRMTSDISGVQGVISDVMTSYFSHFIVIVTTVVALFRQHFLLALIGIALIPLFVLPTNQVGKRRWKLTLETQTQRDQANQMIQESFSTGGQLLTKLFTKEEDQLSRYRDLNHQVTELTIKERMAGRWFWMFLRVVTGLGPIIIYLIGGLMILKGGAEGLTIGDISVIVSLVGRLYRPVEQILGLQVDFTRSMALFTRIFEYFDLPEEIADPVNPKKPEIRGAVEFRQVDFSYLPDKPVLKRISFRVEPGKKIALVGPSGAGKSTVINLVPRLYDVCGGGVYIDGMDVRELELRTLRKSIGIVTQDTYLFNASVRDNLLFAKPGAAEEELIEACRKANIHDLIMTLPQGYDTPVGNGGFKLSGGEKQRLSLARTILKDPRILILDEATSSLDSISEKLIQDAITPLLAGRTAIMIAHRLSTIVDADEILVVEKGEIVDRGTHAQLISRSGTYRTLYETQFRGGEEFSLTTDG